jgi:O-antigen/teichoic acid export membrane protein
MASLLKRGIILSFSRLSNQIILIFSPIILVRLLSVAEYGSYREFILYSSIVVSLVTLGVPQSLQYFIPKQPKGARIWVTQTVLIGLVLAALAIAGIWIAGDQLRARTSLDFVLALQLYVFFGVNLNYLEHYWLGKKRTDYVLYYSTGALTARVLVLIAAAMYSPTAFSLIYAVVLLEIVRFCFVLIFSIRANLFTRQVSYSTFFEQAKYFVPLGLGGMVQVVNNKVGPLYIAIMLGPEILALYVIGAFAMPIINIFRGAVGDVIFPEILELRTITSSDSLPLWRKATVLYCVLMFPTSCILMFFASDIVTILFTADYTLAAPVFQIFATMLVISCFEFHLPLRAQNKNRYFVSGSVVSLICNLLVLYPLATWFGMVGPALAMVASQLVLAIYLGRMATVVYNITVAELLDWQKILMTILAILICLPILILAKLTMEPSIWRLIAASFTFGVAYFALIRAFDVWDISALVRRIFKERYWMSGT